MPDKYELVSHEVVCIMSYNKRKKNRLKLHLRNMKYSNDISLEKN